MFTLKKKIGTLSIRIRNTLKQTKKIYLFYLQAAKKKKKKKERKKRKEFKLKFEKKKNVTEQAH